MAKTGFFCALKGNFLLLKLLLFASLLFGNASINFLALDREKAANKHIFAAVTFERRVTD